MNLSFDGAVAFEGPVMFANSCNVSFEKSEAGKLVSRPSYADPTMLNTKTETNLSANFGFFSKEIWGQPSRLFRETDGWCVTE
jgi:hypothetical protein